MSGSELYKGAVGFCLTGYQLLEEQLKAYLGMHYDITRTLLAGRLHFGHREVDVAKFPLARLIGLFAKTCANDALIQDLRRVVDHRNAVAHRAFLIEFKESPSEADYARLAAEVTERAGEVGKLLERVHNEFAKLPNALRLGNNT